MKKIKISENQYKRVFLGEQKPDHLMPFQPDHDIPGGVMGLMGRSDLTKDEKGKILVKNARKQMDAAVEMSEILGIKSIIDIFNCNSDVHNVYDKNGKLIRNDFWHCVLDDASIAISAIPVIGTVGSGILDAINSLYYLGEAGISLAKGNTEQAYWDLGFAGMSALGIIPGVTEVKTLSRLSKGGKEAGQDLMKKVSKAAGGNPKNVSKLTKEQQEQIMKEVIIGRKLNKKQAKDMKKYLEIMGDLSKMSPDIKAWEKQLDNLMRLNNWKQKDLLLMYKDKNFLKILKSNKGDLLTTLKKWPRIQAAKTLKLQVGLTVGLTLGLYHGINAVRWLYKNKEEKEIKEKYKEELKIIDEIGEVNLMILYQLFNVFAPEMKGGCAPNGGYHPKELFLNTEFAECPQRKAALYAYKKGLRLERPEGIDGEDTRKAWSCICDYLTTDKDWEIVIRAYKKYMPRGMSRKMEFYQNLCVEAIEEVCPYRGITTLDTVTIKANKK
jgi:hypothetical protein